GWSAARWRGSKGIVGLMVQWINGSLNGIQNRKSKIAGPSLAYVLATFDAAHVAPVPVHADGREVVLDERPAVAEGFEGAVAVARRRFVAAEVLPDDDAVDVRRPLHVLGDLARVADEDVLHLPPRGAAAELQRLERLVRRKHVV